MRFAAAVIDHADGARPALGVVQGEEILIPDEPATLLSLLREGGDALPRYSAEARRERAQVVQLADAVLASPLPDPPTVRDFMTFEGHTVGGMGHGDPTAVALAWWEIPTFYFTNPYAICGPQDDVTLAPGTKRFDFEVEVAAIVGAEGFNLPLDRAQRHIAGYSLFVDWSARDIQMHEMAIGLGPAKGKDTASTLGPFFVTADEVDAITEDGRIQLALSVSVNGIEVGRGDMRDMGWEFASLVSYASRGTWVRPGDVLGSGTCNNGCFAERWGREGLDAITPLAVGDLVEVDAGILGVSKNRIVESVTLYPVPSARPALIEERN